MNHIFDVISKKSSPNPSSRFSPVSYSENIRVLNLTFWSKFHFGLIFVKGVKFVYRLIFCMWMSNFSNTICFIVLLLLLCQRAVDYIYMGLFLESVLFY